MIPLSLVCAELATGWPKTGGIYVWVREGLGDRLGFVTGWLYWLENVVWFPTILTFLAATAAYLINPALANNTLYNVVMILVIFWGATFVNLRGMKTSGWISTLCAILGTIIPAVVIIGLATVWLGTGQPSQTPLTVQAFFPQIINSTAPNLPPKAWLAFPLAQWMASATNFSSISLASGLILYYAGMELTGAHAAEVKNPNRDFPKAVLFSTIATIVISVLGTLAVAIVVPAQQIGLAVGIMQAF
jgi:amino acid transporter